MPRAGRADGQGVLLRFDVRWIELKAVDPDNYSLATWHYKRTYQYGSPQFKADGTTGIDRLSQAARISRRTDASVFVGVPVMSPVMQMRVGWSLATRTGRRFQDTAYSTPYELPEVHPQAEGFGDITVDFRAATDRRSRRTLRSAPRKGNGSIRRTAVSRAMRSTIRP